MKSKALLTLLTLFTFILPTTVAGKPQVTFHPTTSGVDVLVDGELFTHYLYQVDPAKLLAAENVLLTKPVLYPLKDRTVNGTFASVASVRSSPQPCPASQAGEGALPLSLKKPKKRS